MKIFKIKNFLVWSIIPMCVSCLGVRSVFCGENDITKIRIKTIEKINVEQDTFYPKWSPNGEYCLFQHLKRKLICYSGRDFKKLFDIPYYNYHPDENVYSLNQWSPDGKYIYGVEEIKDKGMTLVIYKASGEKFFQTQYFQSIDASMMRWSPDSKRIAFHEDLFIMMDEPDIWLADIETKQTKNLTPDKVNEMFALDSITFEHISYGPEWSPSGKDLIYVSGKDSIMMFNLQTNKKATLLSMAGTAGSFIRRLRWSPDGGQIAFHRFGGRKLYVVSSKGKNLREYACGFPFDIVWLGETGLILLYFGAPEFALLDPEKGFVGSWETTDKVGISPDQEYLTYVEKDEHDMCILYIMDVKSQRRKKLAQAKLSYGEPAGKNELSFTLHSRVFWTPALNTFLLVSGLNRYKVVLEGL